MSSLAESGVEPGSKPRCVGGRSRATCLGILAMGLAACGGSDRPVWFGPNIASRDMLRLFTDDGAWKHARDKVGVFKFYAAQVGAWDVCPDCGENDIEHLAAVGAFDKLDRWRIAVAVEAAAVKDWGCTADATLPPIRRALQRVAMAHGQVQLVAMDEPLIGGEDCGQALDSTAKEVSLYAAALRSERPALGVGDIEPYPHFDAATLVAWLDAVAAHGTRLSFFHLDMDRVRAAAVRADVPTDLAALQAACRARGVAFGVIFWGGDGLDEEAYGQDVLAWVDAVSAAIGSPEQIVFQSWSTSVDGRKEVPVNLPEDSTTVWTHTRLLRVGVERLR
jgi:hypothetical protein